MIDSNNDSLARLPSSVTKITVHAWHKPLSLPLGITHLTLGDTFTKNITSLPTTLLYLKFSDYYNRPFECTLPQLTHLIFGANFDRPLEILPSSLTHLTVGPNFTQQINSLPSSLKSFKLGTTGNTYTKYQHPITFLPINLQHVDLCLFRNFVGEIILPPSITKAHVERLNFEPREEVPLILSFVSMVKLEEIKVFGKFVVKDLPNSITNALFNYRVSIQGNLPSNIESLCLHGTCTSDIPLPSTLQQLELDNGNETLYDISGMNNIRELKLGMFPKTPLVHLPSISILQLHSFKNNATIPSSVTQLTVLNECHPPNSLPDSITRLILPSNSNRITSFPQQLTHLTLGLNTHRLPLPQSLLYLSMQVSSDTPPLFLPPQLTDLTIHSPDRIVIKVEFGSHRKLLFSL